MRGVIRSSSLVVASERAVPESKLAKQIITSPELEDELVAMKNPLAGADETNPVNVFGEDNAMRRPLPLVAGDAQSPVAIAMRA